MTWSDGARLRAVARAYLPRVAVGALLGILYGALGVWKAAGTRDDAGSVSDTSEVLRFATIAGAAGGALWYRLRFLRARGRVGHYMSWIASLAIPLTAMSVPYAIQERSWISIGVALFVGVGGGAGFAAYTRDS